MTRQAAGMSAQTRWLILAIIAVLAFGSVTVYAVQAFGRYQARTTGASAAQVTDKLVDGNRIVFRNTAMGQGYGQIASVAIADPAGPRELFQTVCDRVDATAQYISCMRTQRGIPTTFETRILDAQANSIDEWPLSGVPSRTRISEAGLVATTAFVTGHSYATDSFSTETVIRSVQGQDFGNLENYSIFIDGQELTAIDRNVWGVTFATENKFYATVASAGKTWMVEGNLEKRRMNSIIENAECPSVAPDQSKVAYKKRRAQSGLAHWDIAILDLKTQKEIILPLEPGFDDQVEWLDSQTLLFGMLRTESVGDSDVYSIKATTNAQPQLFIKDAWSPSVVRTVK